MANLLKKAEFIEKVAAKLKATKVDTEQSVDAVFAVLKEEIIDNGKDFRVPELGGMIKKVDVNPRTARNPKTGETKNIPAKWKLKYSFKAVEK